MDILRASIWLAFYLLVCFASNLESKDGLSVPIFLHKNRRGGAPSLACVTRRTRRTLAKYPALSIRESQRGLSVPIAPPSGVLGEVRG